MRAILLTLSTCVLLLPLSADEAKEKKPIKEIDIKGVKLEQVKERFNKPTEITSANDLPKFFPDKDVQERIKKEVDFDKQKLLLFAWSGSGQDKVTPNVIEAGGKQEVVFAFQPGRTRDYRGHFKLFVIDKDVAYKLGR